LPRRRLIQRALYFASLLALTGCFVFLSRQGPTPLPRAFGDSVHQYLPQSKAPWLSVTMWGGDRPVAAPLLFKLYNQDPYAIADAQVQLSIVCWVVLGLVLASLVQPSWLKLLAAALVYGFALSHAVVQWNYCLLSESLSLSSFALVLAAWLLLARRFRLLWLVLAGAASLVWASTRDTNAYELLIIGFIVAIAIVRRRLPRAAFIYVAVVIVAFGYASWSTAHGGRWIHPSYNVLNRRILVSPPLERWFVAAGMPLSDALRARAGKSPSADNRANYVAPELEDFRRWWQAHGRAAIARHLLTHPGYALSAPFDDVWEAYAPQLAFYDSLLIGRSWRRELDVAIDPFNQTELVTWLCAMLLLCLPLYWHTRQNIGRPVAVALAGVALVPWLNVLVWHGDAIELGRHCLQNAIQLRLCLWLVLILLFDRLLAIRAAAPSPPPPNGTAPASSPPAAP
jgi:hypothetical protein